jgi:hypothetical protein
LPDKSNILLIAVAVIAGLLVGFAVSTFAYRHRWLRVPGAPILERMSEDLKLTPEQRAQIVQVMRDTRSQLREQHHQFETERHTILSGAFAKIRALLTPEQQARFDKDFAPPPMYGYHHHHHFHGGFGGFGMMGGGPEQPAAPTPSAAPAPPSPSHN